MNSYNLGGYILILELKLCPEVDNFSQRVKKFLSLS